MEIGKRIRGSTRYIPETMLVEPSSGVIYELNIETSGISNPEKVMNTISQELPKKFKGLEVLWTRIDQSRIVVQIKASSVTTYAWGAILLFLPQILSAIGVIITLVSVYLVWSSIPSSIFGLLITGIVMLFSVPKIVGLIKQEDTKK